MSTRRILFIDRDGTLIEEPPDEQIDNLAKLRLVAGVIPALLRLQAAGFTLVMITNQDGLGTASFPEEDFHPPHDLLLHILGSQGIDFAEVLICPHLPAAGCACRKPRLGLVKGYLREGFDRARSYVIGDRASDLALAENMGIEGLRIGPKQGWPEIVRRLLEQPRTGSVTRTTRETAITVEVDLDGPGSCEVATGIGFFDHMLEQLSRHGGFGLRLRCEGDLEVDEHHTVEDCALALGAALRQALGDKHGVGRYGFVLPMDEARAQVALDLSGRPWLEFEGGFSREAVGGLPTELVPHFFRSFADALRATLHITLQGENAHHQIEAAFKGVARALRAACARTGQGVPSTKGVL